MLNSGLILLFLFLFGVSIFMQRRIPARKSLTAKRIALPERKVLSEDDVKGIYENDLFGTYKTPLSPIEEEAVGADFPELPQLKYPEPVRVTQASFLPPLKVALKGVIYASDGAANRAIIADDKTKKEKLYLVGDTVEDAEVIRIERNKVILMRSNGQQEVIFISPAAASQDQIFDADKPWDTAIRKVTDTDFIIDPLRLKQRVSTIGEFIALIDLTTALNQGVPHGCQIGLLKPGSVGPALGLSSGDVILSINDLPVATTQQRVDAYRLFINMPLGATIVVDINRQGRRLELTYMLQDLSEQEAVMERAGREALLQEQPSQSEMQRKDKIMMNNFGGRDALIERPARGGSEL